MVHEGDVYFEHCYSADFSPNVRPAQREACWNAWLAHYTRHQPAHRIDYAMRRVEAFENGLPSPSLPDLGGDPGAAPESDATLEEDTLVTLEGPHAGAEASTTLSTAGGADLTHGCESTCGAAETRCVAACPAEAHYCRDLCKRERALCKGGCY